MPQRFEVLGYDRLRLNTSLPIRKGHFQFFKSMFLTVTSRNPPVERRFSMNDRLTTALEDIAINLERIAEALERIDETLVNGGGSDG